jgi:hypothetical protein
VSASLVAAIAAYADAYSEQFLKQYDAERLSSLLTNWWAALDFFFGRVCYQGRRDEISDRVYRAIIESLAPSFDGDGRDDAYWRLREQAWAPIEAELRMRLGKGKVGRGRDITTALSTLDFIGCIPDLNIVSTSVRQIRAGKIADHYAELQRSRSETGIIGVGPKVAALYLRDVVFLYDLEDRVDPESAFSLQPIDVWVRRVALRYGIVDEGASDAAIQQAIAASCQEHGVSPVRFNQGAWVVGYHGIEVAGMA